MDLESTYNKIARDWHNQHIDDKRWLRGSDLFVSKLLNNALILDVGCGPGLKSNYLLQKGLRVVGIDIANEFITIAKENNPNGIFIHTDMKEASSLPYEFDGIYALASLLHIPKTEIQSIIAILLSKLKPEGFLYVLIKESKGVEEEIVVENDYGYEYERFFSYFIIDEIKELLIKQNLSIVHSESKDGWIQIIAKK